MEPLFLTADALNDLSPHWKTSIFKRLIQFC